MQHQKKKPNIHTITHTLTRTKKRLNKKLFNQVCLHPKNNIEHPKTIDNQVLHFWCQDSQQKEYRLLFSYSLPLANIIIKGLNPRDKWIVKDAANKIIFSN